MKKLLVLSLFLCSCSEQTITNRLVDSAIQQIDIIEQSLSTECKTEIITKQFAESKNIIKDIETSCKIKEQQLSSEKTKWKFSFLSLVFVILIYIVRKILK